MTIKQTLGAIVLAGASGLTGCSVDYKTGTVEKESGTVAQIVESRGALFGNESVKFSDPTYILQIKTEEGVYIASVKSGRQKTIEALATALEEGDRVRFVVNDSYRDGKTFGNDRVGTLYADQIEILPKK
ncbi:hypothetical protein HY772_04000 [Candidatus Woesearchaeota archaeon]|nr:hypothetical protein [Candidatus Woesearchaeota archaeon]